MGTNYYFRFNEEKKEYHIGKSSYGWEFTFQAQPELDIYSAHQWWRFLQENDHKGSVVSEYDETISLTELMDVSSTSLRQKRYDENNSDREHSTIKNHFEYMQEDEYNTMKKMFQDYGKPFYLKVEDVRPTNCWKDKDGYSVSLGEFS